MGKESEVIPTQCEEWSLNKDHESEKTFWWNKTYSISIWQRNVVVAEPLSNAKDVDVWRQFIKFQLSSVYKMCCVCNAPEQKEDMFLCCYCGAPVHVECSIAAKGEQLAWKPANEGFEDHMRVCFHCEDIKNVATKPISREPDDARRCITRALTIEREYTPSVSQELHRLLKRRDIAENNEAVLAQVRFQMQTHFQPHNSQSWLKKQKIEKKKGGTGVVAVQAIPRFTIVGVYPGYEDPLSGEQAKNGRPSPIYSLVDLNCADYFNIVFGELQDTFTPFFNEPCESEESNCAWIQETSRPEGRLSVITVRDIDAGEEMMIGYGPMYPRTYPYRYDAYAFHKVDGFDDPCCFGLWHWTSVEEKDSSFVCYVGYDAQSDTYYYWETEEEANAKKKSKETTQTVENEKV